ncbi:MAG: hypothetical protein AB7V50_11630 [Vampirovibrionia bacterium]
MTSIISVPSSFYKSSDFFSPGKISSEISRLSGLAIPSLETSINTTIKDSQELVTLTSQVLEDIYNNPIAAGLDNTAANQYVYGTTSALSSLIGTGSSNYYQSANSVLATTNDALNAVLNEGVSSQTTSTANQIMSEINFALSYIFGSDDEEVSSTTTAQTISNNVNSSLSSILTGDSTQSNTFSSILMNSVTTNLEEILEDEETEETEEETNVFANSGNSAELFSYVSSGYDNIFSTNNGESTNTYAGSKNSYNLFASVNSWLEVLFAEPV